MFKLRRGGQGNALTDPAFVLTIDPVLKFTELKFEGVNVRATGMIGNWRGTTAEINFPELQLVTLSPSGSRAPRNQA